MDAATISTRERVAQTVNFHFIKNCNFRCKFCFATFDDTDSAARGNRLPDHELHALTRLLARRYTKVTFAGGEPTIYSRVAELIATAKAEGALTNVVSNGYRITPEWFGQVAGNLDLLTLSIDSDSPDTHRTLGRATIVGDTTPPERYQTLTDVAREVGTRVKVNTVVTQVNQTEDISGLLRALRPERWKVLQAAPVEGQNDAYIGALTTDDADFDAYVARHKVGLAGSGIRIVAEPIETIRGSYIMVDPQGRFFDSTTGVHRYSAPILEVGIDAALDEVQFDADKFQRRGGTADFTGGRGS